MTASLAHDSTRGAAWHPLGLERTRSHAWRHQRLADKLRPHLPPWRRTLPLPMPSSTSSSNLRRCIPGPFLAGPPGLLSIRGEASPCALPSALALSSLAFFSSRFFCFSTLATASLLNESALSSAFTNSPMSLKNFSGSLSTFSSAYHVPSSVARSVASLRIFCSSSILAVASLRKAPMFVVNSTILSFLTMFSIDLIFLVSRSISAVSTAHSTLTGSSISLSSSLTSATREPPSLPLFAVFLAR
mmetsp:Transcript_19823/g.40367  ORF Transcript_19823/g.40367 Transcript_19823/m.40367 type:complete len:245 (+) Transcript_19823:439-1173(+)